MVQSAPRDRARGAECTTRSCAWATTAQAREILNALFIELITRVINWATTAQAREILNALFIELITRVINLITRVISSINGDDCASRRNPQRAVY